MNGFSAVMWKTVRKVKNKVNYRKKDRRADHEFDN